MAVDWTSNTGISYTCAQSVDDRGWVYERKPAHARLALVSLVISDAVTLDVLPLADLAVTLYLPGEIPPGFQITGRYARQTHYISPPGNFATAITMPVGKITDEWFFVSGIDVLASPETGGVVALGDSLTDLLEDHGNVRHWAAHP